jgi:hypothetical protein
VVSLELILTHFLRSFEIIRLFRYFGDAAEVLFTCPLLPHKLSSFGLKLSALSLGKTSLVGYL